jgi:hypothetical protein
MRLAPAFLLALSLTTPRLHAQAGDIPSAAPPLPNGQTQEQRGQQLLDQMVAALGGPVWLGRTNISVLGKTAAFFRNAPTGQVIEYAGYHQLPGPNRPEAERIEFITDKGMIMPGKKRDVAQVWTDDGGFEITFKGVSPLPKDQVDDYLRRRAHSIEAVVATWIKAPGVIIIAEGTTMVQRHQADKVTILSANNDAVTIELDINTHLPLSRSFTWRNTQFQDHDEDREEYDDYHTFQGLPTPLTLTRYRNGDMVSQRFLTKVEYNVTIPPDSFNPEKALIKKK